MKDNYNDNFYLQREGLKRSSAQNIIPLVIKLINPVSVLDVGCGIGTWLSVVKEHGIETFRGIDGAWVNRELLRIDKESFTVMDLEKPSYQRKTFDLVVSLEVAEHLPENKAAGFVDFLISHGPVVLFSAAIPLQGGVDHINEQWQSYWIDLFDKAGFLVADVIRKRVWDDDKVLSFYAQNSFLFVNKKYISNYPLLQAEMKAMPSMPFNIVHPRHYEFRLVPLLGRKE